MNVRDLITVLVIFGVVVLGIVYLTPSYAENSRLANQLSQIKQVQEEKKLVLDRKRMEIGKLSIHDPLAIERVLRERYGYCKANENIIQFKASSQN